MYPRHSVGLSAAFLAAGQFAAGHMSMEFPLALRSKSNPNVDEGKIDYSMTSPLAADGSDYPCKGYQSDLGSDAGRATAEFAAGGRYNVTVAGGANHNGGSCQISLSYDRGATFRVVKSFIGGCPSSSSTQLDFGVPADASAGLALLAWTWNNKMGNREMYMNCAAVTIIGRVPSRRDIRPRAAFNALPSVFKANIGNGCTVTEGVDLMYPDPGPDVVTSPDATPQAPEGDCASSAASAPAPVAPIWQPNATATATATATANQPPSSTGISPGLSSGVIITGPDSPAANIPVATNPVGTGVSIVAPAPAPGNGSTADARHASGTPCTREGTWNCVDGRSFQRCASGSWSVVLRMAAGTSCEIGEGETLNTGPRLSGAGKSLSAPRTRLRR